MKNKALEACSYIFQPGESIMVDANVWRYLLPPAAQPVSRWASAYSRAYGNMLSAKATPVVDALILSEYLNRYLRIEYSAFWARTYRDFKSFRQSADAANTLGNAVAELEQIARVATVCDTPLADIDLTALFGQIQSGTIDFNDGLLVENCRRNGWKLLTNDSDMTMGGIEVLTTNTRLLRACP
jgi:predicted nucleic acid-binding protein